jgi:predicted transposase/invertase (TIGR01784 family)
MLTAVKENGSSYEEKTTDYDGLWKDSIEELFREFMQYFAPDLYPEINFEKGVTSVDKELHQLSINSKKGRKFPDKVVKAAMKNGGEKYILVHIEVQAIGKEEFAKRMFKYFYRVYDKYSDFDIYAIALLTDAKHKNHADKYNYSFYGTALTYKYNTFKFHEKDIGELKQSSNPFSIAVLAGIYASKSAGKSENENGKRYNFKKELVNLAYEKYDHHETYLSALLYFIDFILKIPPEWNEKLYASLPLALKKKEEGKLMGMEKLKDTPTFGRLYRDWKAEGVEEGKREGRREGKKEAEKNFARKLLERNFSDEEITQLTELKIEEVKRLRESLDN